MSWEQVNHICSSEKRLLALGYECEFGMVPLRGKFVILGQQCLIIWKIKITQKLEYVQKCPDAFHHSSSTDPRAAITVTCLPPFFWDSLMSRYHAQLFPHGAVQPRFQTSCFKTLVGKRLLILGYDSTGKKVLAFAVCCKMWHCRFSKIEVSV